MECEQTLRSLLELIDVDEEGGFIVEEYKELFESLSPTSGVEEGASTEKMYQKLFEKMDSRDGKVLITCRACTNTS